MCGWVALRRYLCQYWSKAALHPRLREMGHRMEQATAAVQQLQGMLAAKARARFDLEQRILKVGPSGPGTLCSLSLSCFFFPISLSLYFSSLFLRKQGRSATSACACCGRVCGCG